MRPAPWKPGRDGALLGSAGCLLLGVVLALSACSEEKEAPSPDAMKRQYEQDAKKEITPENVQEEADRLMKEIEQDSSGK